MLEINTSWRVLLISPPLLPFNIQTSIGGRSTFFNTVNIDIQLSNNPPIIVQNIIANLKHTVKTVSGREEDIVFKSATATIDETSLRISSILFKFSLKLPPNKSKESVIDILKKLANFILLVDAGKHPHFKPQPPDYKQIIIESLSCDKDPTLSLPNGKISLAPPLSLNKETFIAAFYQRTAELKEALTVSPNNISLQNIMPPSI